MDIEGQAHVPLVVGLALLHPCFSGEGRPQLARLLTHSRWVLISLSSSGAIQIVSVNHLGQFRFLGLFIWGVSDSRVNHLGPSIFLG